MESMFVLPYSAESLLVQGFQLIVHEKKAKLTPAMSEKRLKWAHEVRNKFGEDWSKVCFSEESIFSICEEIRQYVRRKIDEEFSELCIVQTVKHPMSVMVWSVISTKGTG